MATITITRAELASAIWTDIASATHAVRLDSADGVQAWHGVTESDAATFARQHGADRVAVVVDGQDEDSRERASEDRYLATLAAADSETGIVTIHVGTDGLRQGDVVLTHGMRVELDRPIRVHSDYSSSSGTVHSTVGRVLNVDDVRAAGIVPMGYLHREGDEYRWTIQGNALARWTAERTVS
jgi:hypothetical protein